MEALADSMTDDHPARPVLVLSNRPDAGGLEKAKARDIPTQVVDHKTYESRERFEDALQKALTAFQPDILALAGFMRILTPGFVSRWEGRILNIHPSLLPKYPGLRTHQRAIEAGDAEAGCSVHEVTAELDAGPILGQARVAILLDDTEETLAKRVLTAEHQLYPAVLNRFATGDKRPVNLP